MREEIWLSLKGKAAQVVGLLKYGFILVPFEIVPLMPFLMTT